ncbi:Guanine deaminase [Trichinella pseudospiralis]|uniref:Guanine deaminase n=4 Tax=Trichinella pseudospiralis TaxID=6337 RepID=A0A0V1JPJ6_TRIPS|nr:Guanine deaminase [Trichinella pseudospiralis]KRZ36888.1 Guanine deaminase [Trichinella pseudospiralis]
MTTDSKENTEALLKMACQEAERGVESDDGGPFGALVVKNGRILAIGHNEVLLTNDPTAHAEVTVIRRAAAALGHWNLAGCELYTSCKPCPMCLGAALWSGIEKIYYSLSEEDAAAAGFRDKAFYDLLSDSSSLNAYMEHVPVVGMENAMQMWINKENKEQY